MLPSAAPMILWFGALNRRRSEGARTLIFVAAYLTLWTGFSGAAAATQWALQSAGWVSPMIVSTSPVLSGALLLIAGVFQLSRDSPQEEEPAPQPCIFFSPPTEDEYTLIGGGKKSGSGRENRKSLPRSAASGPLEPAHFPCSYSGRPIFHRHERCRHPPRPGSGSPACRPGGKGIFDRNRGVLMLGGVGMSLCDKDVLVLRHCDANIDLEQTALLMPCLCCDDRHFAASDPVMKFFQPVWPVFRFRFEWPQMALYSES
jgi:hypothetical protein